MPGVTSAPARAPVPAMSARALTPAALREAALAHLAQYATSRAGLIRVLDRRIGRWANLASADPDNVTALRQAARQVADQLAAEGLVNDRAFADGRALRLARAGRSRQAIAAHLTARGIGGEVVQAALPDTELAAALATARRRRIGPFRTAPLDREDRGRELAILARAGFSRAIAAAALATPADQADAIILQLKRG